MKHCTQCKWMKPQKVFGIIPTPNSNKWAFCTHPNLTDPVTDKPLMWCLAARHFEAECGPDAKLWEAK
jgi:hypothetical protein